MKDDEKTASKTFAALLAAESAIEHETAPGEDADAACHRRIVLHDEIDNLEIAGPNSAFAKIYVGLTEAATACPEEESGINFAYMRALLCEHLRPASLAIPIG